MSTATPSGARQVGAAFEWLVEHAEEGLADARFVVSATTHGSGTAAGSGGRGIYLREPQHTRAGDVGCAAFVKPTLHEAAPNTARVALDVTVTLTPSASWVSCGTSLALTHGGKGFDLKLACGALPPGCHFAEVRSLRRLETISPCSPLLCVLSPASDLHL